MIRACFCILLLLLSLVKCKPTTQSKNSDEKNNIDWNYADSAWTTVADIIKHIKKPEIKFNKLNILDFGAQSDGKFNNRMIIQGIIDSCHQKGGCKIIIPSGKFLTGALQLKSNINLHLEKDATLLFTTDTKEYLPLIKTHWEGMEIMNFAAPIFASESENISITGQGIIDGNADFSNWWQWSAENQHKLPHNRPRLMKLNRTKRPVDERIFGEGHQLRPNFIQFYKCRKILIEGVTVRNSPMWNIHTILTENITIDGITVEAPYESPNTDALDFESSRNILVQNSRFDVGDDCITIKSGRNQDGRRINTPTENVIARNCIITNGRGGIVIGSEITGGARNIFMEDCHMDSPNLNRAVRIKSSEVRGGHIENVFVRNITVGQVAGPILNIDLHYGVRDAERSGELFIPTCKNVFIENVTCKEADHAWYLDGYENSPIQNIFMRNIIIENVNNPIVQKDVENLYLENVRIGQNKANVNIGN